MTGNRDKPIPVAEIFGPTIQGEGAMIGQPTYFVRTGGCDFACKMCDSLHAVTPEEVNKLPKMTGKDIAVELLRLPGFESSHPATLHSEQFGWQIPRWVTFSGGNPCIWDGLEDTMNILQDNDRIVYIAVETQGTIFAPWLNRCDQITISPKAPGMGEKYDKNVLRRFCDLLDTDIYAHYSCFKIVVFKDPKTGSYKRDLDFVVRVMDDFNLDETDMYISQGNSYTKSVVGPYNDPSERLMDEFPRLLSEVFMHPQLHSVKVLPQLHVWVWGNATAV